MKKKIYNLPNSKEIARNASLLLSICSLLYHIVFLFVFLHLKVKPMFFFNIVSVCIFITSTISWFKRIFIIPSFVIAFLEVITHQIFAEYYVGIETNFHFFMLVISLLAFIIFREKRVHGLTFSIISAFGFIVMEMLRGKLTPVYELSFLCVQAIKFTNISCVAFMFVYRIFEYSKMTYRLEFSLVNKVENLAKTMQKKNEELIKIQDNTIISLSNLVENRDRDTGKHVQRTSAYVKMLATEAKKEGLFTDYLTEERINLLGSAAPMHDIGKIVVSDVILKKPGRLTEEEFSEMKRHASEGGRIINDVLGNSGSTEYLKIASEIATNHHEKWDGSGYPKHKKADEIPISARIMAIADVFDALVSVRCYKDPMPDEIAFGIIEKDSGIHFDPDLARVFLKNKEKVIEIKERLKD